MDSQILIVSFGSTSGARWLLFGVPPKNVAVEKHFYTNDEEGIQDTSVETYLANDIEGPASSVINKIRARKNITAFDKMNLSTYINVMVTRTPAYKKRMNENLPEYNKIFRKESFEGIDRRVAEGTLTQKFASNLKAQIDNTITKMNGGLPKKYFLRGIKPNHAPYINSMRWIFFTHNTGRGFLTSDNPVFWLSSFRTNPPFTEISFPLASDIALWACWVRRPDRYLPISQNIEQEINRRTIFHADRFVYYSKEKEWVTRQINTPIAQIEKKITRIVVPDESDYPTYD